MGDLSENFSRWEFSCDCGCGLDTVDAELLYLCEIVRKMEDGPLMVNSGHRCEAYNSEVGGAPKTGTSIGSQHLYGKAADLAVSDPEHIYDQLCQMFPDKYGFGLYLSWVHVDSRKEPARWAVV